MPAANNPATDNHTTSLDACNPALNATVSASAGSGKTWLLITRLVRLLIAGAEPGNIIALTFTRKAAAEMQLRLNQRLFELATADEDKLPALLQQIGCSSSAQHRAIAAGLYEQLMHSLYPVRIQTFHSFCQDILSRFPLEADIPPGFELIEDTSLLERQAWQTLFSKAATPVKSRQPVASAAAGRRYFQQQLSDQLDIIMQFCNGPDNTLNALRSFLAHRSDWWAYTAGRSQAVDFACDSLAQSLQIEPAFRDNKQPPEEAFFSSGSISKLQIFTGLLRQINNITSDRHAHSIDQALNKESDYRHRFSLIESAFIKKDGDKLVQGRQYNASLEKKLGAENATLFIELHEHIAEHIQQLKEQKKRLLSLHINSAWYFAGHHYVEIFQQLKRQLRLLDFTDLEWKCYQLLQHAENAHWVQYKIDQRIDHILIDEFQDTNPTQWHLLSPILDEIAAAPGQRPRSVFLVGDEKQSIYSFRRANPALQAKASQWLADNLHARATPLDFSRRSSAAIIDSVNAIFQQPQISAVMSSYTRHDTYLKDLPGQVMLCELFTEEQTGADENSENSAADGVEQLYFRNPLLQPRESNIKTLRHKEADYIARQILQLVNTRTLITDNGVVRHIGFGDIMILMRNRTHVEIYEEALKQHGISFIGSKKGGLLDNLEIQDLSCLLNTLITPYDNLALAQLLKSPIFDASDEDLITLATEKSSSYWYERLLKLCADPRSNSSSALKRAAHLLPQWQQLAQHLPVHDCLDSIFSQGNIIKRYLAANSAENRDKVAANCQRFLQLSLETDSGRYPSISRFLQQLKQLENYSSSPPEEALSQSETARVRLLTIHASKGLESPVVFLADCNSSSTNRNAYASLVHWPAEASRPVNFQLQLNRDNTDQITEKLQQQKLAEQSREELNLLYVALTRAREQLYISGVASTKSMDSSWYQIISAGLQAITEAGTTVAGTGCRLYTHLHYANQVISSPPAPAEPAPVYDFDARLLQPMATEYVESPASDFMIAPSLYRDNTTNNSSLRAESGNTDWQSADSHSSSEASRWRGIIIHRILEQLCKTAIYPATEQSVEPLYQQLKTDILLRQPVYITQLDDCMHEAVSAFNHEGFVAIFNPAAGTHSYNEMPLMYRQQQQSVFGIVDRVLRSQHTVLIIDYKSHQLQAGESAEQASGQYATQLGYYAQGIKKLWPQHIIRTGIILTRYKKLVWLS